MDIIWSLCNLIVSLFELCATGVILLGLFGFIFGTKHLRGFLRKLFYELFDVYDEDDDTW